jgi:hypothetical protein
VLWRPWIVDVPVKRKSERGRGGRDGKGMERGLPEPSLAVSQQASHDSITNKSPPLIQDTLHRQTCFHCPESLTQVTCQTATNNRHQTSSKKRRKNLAKDLIFSKSAVASDARQSSRTCKSATNQQESVSDTYSQLMARLASSGA